MNQCARSLKFQQGNLVHNELNNSNIGLQEETNLGQSVKMLQAMMKPVHCLH